MFRICRNVLCAPGRREALSHASCAAIPALGCACVCVCVCVCACLHALPRPLARRLRAVGSTTRGRQTFLPSQGTRRSSRQNQPEENKRKTGQVNERTKVVTLSHGGEGGGSVRESGDQGCARRGGGGRGRRTTEGLGRRRGVREHSAIHEGKVASGNSKLVPDATSSSLVDDTSSAVFIWAVVGVGRAYLESLVWFTEVLHAQADHPSLCIGAAESRHNTHHDGGPARESLEDSVVDHAEASLHRFRRREHHLRFAGGGCGHVR